GYRAMERQEVADAQKLFQRARTHAPRVTDHQALRQPSATLPPLAGKAPPPKVTRPPGSPRKFTFDYKSVDPGLRRWVLNGTTWTETQPSGLQNTFVVMG